MLLALIHTALAAQPNFAATCSGLTQNHAASANGGDCMILPAASANTASLQNVVQELATACRREGKTAWAATANRATTGRKPAYIACSTGTARPASSYAELAVTLVNGMEAEDTDEFRTCGAAGNQDCGALTKLTAP